MRDKRGIEMNDSRTDERGLRMRSHCVHMENRGLVSITGVTDVGAFDEHEVILSTEAGGMTVEGRGLHILRLDIEGGQVTVEGEICAVIYEDEPERKQGSLFSRMFR